MHSDVVIVGAGPTGLTLAIDLGRRGVRCTLIEQKERPAFLPKMERINARPWKSIGAWGSREKSAPPGCRPDCPMDVYIVTRSCEPPLLHRPYPSVAEAQAGKRSASNEAQCARALSAHLAIHARAALEGVAETLPTVTVRFGCELLSLRQNGDGVTARRADRRRRDARSGAPISSAAMAAPARCASELGIRLSGEGNILQLRQALYDATNCSTACR